MTDQCSGFRWIQKVVYGDMMKDSATAMAVAEILIKHNFGAAALEEQVPLTATADGDYWQVEGSLNKGSKESGAGPVKIRFSKSDARVVSFHFSLVGVSLDVGGDSTEVKS